MKDPVVKISRSTCIGTKDEYAEFTGRLLLSKPEIKKNLFLKLANIEKDKEEENSSAKRISFNSEVFLSFIFIFFMIFCEFI